MNGVTPSWYVVTMVPTFQDVSFQLIQPPHLVTSDPSRALAAARAVWPKSDCSRICKVRIYRALEDVPCSLGQMMQPPSGDGSAGIVYLGCMGSSGINERFYGGFAALAAPTAPLSAVELQEALDPNSPTVPVSAR